jgi:hypothetical protein
MQERNLALLVRTQKPCSVKPRHTMVKKGEQKKVGSIPFLLLSLCFTNPTRCHDMVQSFYPPLVTGRGKKATGWHVMLQKRCQELGSPAGSLIVFRLTP